MDTWISAKTVAIKSCATCARGLLEYDKFCRWCGVRQPEGLSLSPMPAVSQSSVLDSENSAPIGRLCNRVSGPLIKAVIEGMTSGATGSGRGSLMRGAIVALVSVPMWLMIVLLSPLDAYAAARSLVRQI